MSSHFFWLSRCLNKQQKHARCFVFDPQLRPESVDKLLPMATRQTVQTIILIMCVGRQEDGTVFFGSNQCQGDHWSLCVIDARDGLVRYCDTLGWPAPNDLAICVINYSRSLGLVHVKQLKITLAHTANKEQHSCCDGCTNYPLQTCSDICGVVVMVCTAIAALDKKFFNLLMQPLESSMDLYLIDPTEYSTYLRYVLMSWLASSSIDMTKISLRPNFSSCSASSKLIPRSVGSGLSVKRKFPSEELELSKSLFSKSSSRFQQQNVEVDDLSKFITDAKIGKLTSQELLEEVGIFFNQSNASNAGKKQQEQFSFQKLCEGLNFNCAVERCQNDIDSLRQYVQEFIQRPGNPVILFKMPGKELGKTLRPIDKDDYLVAIQTSFQKTLLETYGKNCVCLEISRKSERIGLHCNIVTVSVFYEGVYEIPVAWLLSNSTDSPVIEHFFEALSRNVGRLTTNIFIGDIQSELYKQWVKFFPKPGKKMFCFWETSQVILKQMRNSITDQSCVTQLKEYLNISQHIKNKEAFDIYISAFLVIVKQQSQSLCNYLREKFLNHPRDEYWAFCYRVTPLSKSVSFLKSFQENLKSINFFGDGSSGRLDVVFHKLMQLSIFVERSLVESSSEAKQAAALRDIQRRHQQRSGNFEFYSSASRDEWCILPSDDNNLICILDSSIDDCDCPFSCSICKICVHKYICSCSLYLLNIGGCEHIHALHAMKKVNDGINNTSRSLSSPSGSQIRNEFVGNGFGEGSSKSTYKRVVELL